MEAIRGTVLCPMRAVTEPLVRRGQNANDLLERALFEAASESANGS
jgi:hypothetical protein